MVYIAMLATDSGVYRQGQFPGRESGDFSSE